MIMLLGLAVTALLAGYVILVNILVSAALVPSFMEKLDAFERITKESYAAQVQTSDIKINRNTALKETKEWLKTAKSRKISRKTEEGYRLIAEEFPAEDKDNSAQKSHKWVLLLHGYTGWKEEMYPFARWYHQQGYHVVRYSAFGSVPGRYQKPLLLYGLQWRPVVLPR